MVGYCVEGLKVVDVSVMGDIVGICVVGVYVVGLDVDGVSVG